MQLNTNFDLSDNVWWRSDYYPYTNEQIIDCIQRCTNAIKTLIDDPCMQPYFVDVSDEIRYKYIIELLRGELNIDLNINITDIEKIINQNYVNSKQELKIKNIYNATNYLFKESFFPKLNCADFTIELAKKLHKIIGSNNLIPNAGSYRTKPASPANEDYEYSNPNEIESKMSFLFDNIREMIASNTNIIEKIKIGSVFLSNFLKIHPFSNGNGRVARLLLSFILANISVVPVSIGNEKHREIYLQCLRESQKNISEPIALSVFILENVMRMLQDACYKLDLNY